MLYLRPRSLYGHWHAAKIAVFHAKYRSICVVLSESVLVRIHEGFSIFE